MTPLPPTLLSIDLLQPLRWETIFPVARPVVLDLGAGDGGFALRYAAARPEVNVLAVERLMGRARKILRRAEREKRENLRVLRLESGYVVERLCAPESVAEIHLLFADPWPKRRHQDRRLLQPAFLDAAWRALGPGGVFRFVTDHEDYFAHGREVFAGDARFQLIAEPFDYPMTDFETGFRTEGRPIHGGVWARVEL